MPQEVAMRYVTPILLRLGLYHPLRKAWRQWRVGDRGRTEVFSDIYRSNAWQGDESRSGRGSSLAQTQVVIAALPALLARHRVRSMLDIPCGDFHWMSRVDLSGVDYVGADIVPELIEANRAAHGGPGRDFRVLDLCRDPLPAVDLVFCRDCLVHLPFAMIDEAIANLRASGATWLLATTFVDQPVNHDIALGDFRPIDLCKPPFAFPPPVEWLMEGCTEAGGAHSDKALGLWRIASLPG
jgi:hypothetical protein